jgi:hypothetical protein
VFLIFNCGFGVSSTREPVSSVGVLMLGEFLKISFAPLFLCFFLSFFPFVLSFFFYFRLFFFIFFSFTDKLAQLAPVG